MQNEYLSRDLIAATDNDGRMATLERRCEGMTPEDAFTLLTNTTIHLSTLCNALITQYDGPDIQTLMDKAVVMMGNAALTSTLNAMERQFDDPTL